MKATDTEGILFPNGIRIKHLYSCSHFKLTIIYKLDKGSHSVYALQYHLVQCIKYRKKALVDEKIVDLLKLSQKPNEPEYALHLPLDMNLTPNWIARSLSTVFGYEPPQGFREAVNYNSRNGV